MKRNRKMLASSLVLLALGCDTPFNPSETPADLNPGFAANGNANKNDKPFRFVDNDWGNEIVGEVQASVRDLFMMNLVAGNSKGVVNNPAVNWQTSDPQVATVTALNGRGHVRMVGPGYVTISASLGNAQATARFHVLGAPDNYQLTSSNAAPAVGAPVTIRAQLADQLNEPLRQAGRVVTWSSTNGGTFSAPTSTTDADGVATVVFVVGTNTAAAHLVTATDEDAVTGATAVSPQAGAAARVEVALITNVFSAGSSVPVFATVFDAFDNPVPDASVTWSWTGALGFVGVNPGFTDNDGSTLGVFLTPPAAGSFQVTAKSGAATSAPATFSTIVVTP